MKKQAVQASEFDKKFEDGDSVLEYLDLDTVSKPGNRPKRVSIDFPEWMVAALDKNSKKLGVSRQSLIKVFISEKLKEGAGLSF